jgi:endonuclease/exonuclease/phosphatase family metal-dependent hydrolase
MKIMSFNTQHCLNYLEQKIDYDIMANTIKTVGADIVGLNEMYSEADVPSDYINQTKKLSELTGIENYYFAKAIQLSGEGAYGNGLLSKYKIVEAKTIKVPDPNPRRCPNGYYETRCVLKAKLENGYTVIDCHFGLNPDEQENAVKTILENLEEEKCILMGDFNVTPEDSVLLPLYEKLKDASQGFCKHTPTFPSDKPRIKIDYIFVSPDITVEYAEIPEIIASDHRVHIAEIK